jgi:DNA-directed RNA polymerase specialized sigma24 family protein
MARRQIFRRLELAARGGEALAEDLLSDVFLDVWRQAAKFEARSSVSTWLLAIARYKAQARCSLRTSHGAIFLSRHKRQRRNASIAQHDALILSHRANPDRCDFRERHRSSSAG